MMAFLTLTLFWVLQAPPAFAFTASLPNLEPVNDHIYRGGRPTKAGLDRLADMHVTVIIDLENEKTQVKKEKSWAQDHGMQFYSFPMGWTYPPDDSEIQDILDVLSQNDETVYIHCKHGEDRTGLLVGLYRIHYENWSAQKAYKEMLDLGFHKKLSALDDYFKNKSGY